MKSRSRDGLAAKGLLLKQFAISFCCHSEKYLNENTILAAGLICEVIYSSRWPNRSKVFHFDGTPAKQKRESEFNE